MSTTINPAEIRPSKRTRFSSETDPSSRAQQPQQDGQSHSQQTCPVTEVSSPSQTSGLSCKANGSPILQDRAGGTSDPMQPRNTQDPPSDAISQPSKSHSQTDQEQSLTPWAETPSQEQQLTVLTVDASENDLEISQYDIWSDCDQEELDALEELETSNGDTSQLSASKIILDQAKPPSEIPSASNEPVGKPESDKVVLSPDHQTSSVQKNNPNGPSSSPDLQSNPDPSPISGRLKRNVSSLFSTGAGQPFPLEIQKPTISPSFQPNISPSRQPSVAPLTPASIAPNTANLPTHNSSETSETRLHEPSLSKPRRAISSLFQTGAGLPFPMDISAEEKALPSDGNPASPVFGFQTARGNSVAAPSRESMRKALDICNNTNLSPFPKPHDKEPDSPSPSHRAKIQKSSQLPFSPNASPIKTSAYNSQEDGSGSLAPTPSSQHQEHPSADRSSMDPPINKFDVFKPSSIGLFSTGSGAPINIPVSAVERARALLDNPSKSSALQARSTNDSCSPLTDVSNLRPSSHINHKMATTTDLAGSVTHQPNNTLSTKLHGPLGAIVPRIPSQPTTAASLMSTPIRTLSNGMPRPNPQNSPHQLISLPSAPHTTTAPVRRISNRIHIGLTPQSSCRRVSHDGKGAESRSFITPFKKKFDVHHSTSVQFNPLFTPARESPHPRQEIETPSLDPSRRSVLYMDPPTSLGRQGSSGRPQSVFDLSKNSTRIPMAKWLASPKGYSARHLLSLAVPESVVYMTAKSAAIWNFNALTEPFGAIQALGELLQAGCLIGRSTPKWVANHWGLIIWKLAGMVRWQPDCLSRVWNPSNAVQQLKYRYEREFVCGHRSALKRILDSDCPSTMPMCLVIVGIIRPPAHSSPIKGCSPPSEVLELSDGWYKIKAHLDPVLVRVLKRGTLRVGFKLAISGASTEAPITDHSKSQQMEKRKKPAAKERGPCEEGVEEEMRLYLQGNATSRAQWAESLGLRPRPWVANLSSLTPDGGKIPLMDILIVKVYPPTFVDQDGRMGRWELAQEKKLQVAWEKEREREAAKIALEQEKELERIKEVAHLVASIYGPKHDELRRLSADQKMEDDGEDPGFDADDMCDNLIEGEVLPKELQSLPVEKMIQLRHAVQRRYESFRSTGSEELQRKLNDRVPLRRTRNVQVVHFRDFQSFKQRSPSRPSLLGQLSVQDLSRLPDGFFKEGSRYWVENLQPQRNARWDSSSSSSHSSSRAGPCEVPLTTRRDTRWTIIGLDA